MSDDQYESHKVQPSLFEDGSELESDTEGGGFSLDEQGKQRHTSGRKKTVEQPSAYDRAIMLLAPREHSVAELKRKLGAHEYSMREIDEAITQLQQDGLQSDERFCEIFVRSRISRGQGPIKIESALRERGVESSHIAFALENAEVDWFEMAFEVLERKFHHPAESLKEKSKQLRFLASRGFTAEASYNALDQLKKEG